MSVVGGIVVRSVKRVDPVKLNPVETSESNDVSWTWYDKSKGIVEWRLKNLTSSTKYFVLYRNGYYFGNAYFPIYLEYSKEFNTGMLNSLQPLVNNSDAALNYLPLGVVKLPNGKYIVAFVFAISANSEYDVLEGGFSEVMTPSDFVLYEVVPSAVSMPVCIGYSEEQVAAWDMQTHTLMTGYTPNPSTFNTFVFTLSDGPNVSLFPDSIVVEACANDNNKDCYGYVEDILEDLEAGNTSAAIKDVITVLKCLLENYPLKREFKDEIEKLRIKL